MGCISVPVTTQPFEITHLLKDSVQFIMRDKEDEPMERRGNK